MTKKSNSNGNDIDMDQDTPLDLKGAEQHHKLKNQPGEKGDPDHASDDGGSSDQLDDAVEDGDDDTAVGSALKKAVED